MKTVIVAIIIILALSGCQFALEHSQRELEDYNKTIQISKNTLPFRMSQVAFAIGYSGRQNLTEETNKLMSS